jgi:hypothetical protein
MRPRIYHRQTASQEDIIKNPLVFMEMLLWLKYFNTKAFIEKYFTDNKLINHNKLTGYSMFFFTKLSLSKDTIFKAQKPFVIRHFLFLYL